MSQISRVLLSLLAISGAAHARELAQLGPLRANAGEAVSGYLEVAASGDQGARIPISLVRGSADGPTVSLTPRRAGWRLDGLADASRSADASTDLSG